MNKLHVCLVAAACMTSPIAQAQILYTFQNLGTLGVQAEYGLALTGLNAKGQITAQEQPNNLQSLSVVTGPDGQNAKVIPSLGGDQSAPTGLNALGRVVGFSSLGDGTFHAFVTAKGNGSMLDLGTLGGPDSQANGISDNGIVVGWSNITPSDRFPFKFDSRNSMSQIPMPPGATGGEAWGVNKRGEIAGMMETRNGEQPFVTQANGDGAIALGNFGGFLGIAVAINARGEAVGFATDKNGVAIGFITNPRKGQEKISYVDPDSRSVQITAINDSGAVVGFDYSYVPLLPDRAVVAFPGKLKLQILDNIVAIPDVHLLEAQGINNSGQIVARGDDNNVYLLTPIK